MPAWKPSAADALFTLYHAADFDAVRQIPAFGEATPDLVEAMLQEAARIAEDVVAPINERSDRVGAQWTPEGVRFPEGFAEAWRTLGEGGWIGLPFPTALGGQAMPESLFNVFAEWIPAASLGFAQTMTLTAGAIEALIAHASDELIERFVPKLVSGEWTGTMNLTEPQAGSDVGALRTSARRMPDGSYRIKGQKIYITSGEHDMTDNIVHLVLARVEGAPAGTAGISLFVVPRVRVNADGSLEERNDVRCQSIEKKLGIHGSATCVMVYGDADECEGLLIGEENRGMAAMFTMMNAARLHVGLQGLGCADRAYQAALEWAEQRVQGVPVGREARDARPIIEHPDVRRMLMDMRVKIEAARAICYRASTALDIARHHPDEAARQRGQDELDLLTPMAKSYATDIGCEVASEAIQVFGGMGFIEETGVAQIYRDVRITPIYEGTNGIQAWDLANRKLKTGGGRLWQTILEEIRNTVAELSDTGLDKLAPALLNAAESVEDIAHQFLQLHAGKPSDVAAGSVAFQRLFATTVAAWLLTRNAIAAARELNQGANNSAFLNSRIVFARYYIERHLSAALGLRASILAGADDLFELDASQLGPAAA